MPSYSTDRRGALKILGSIGVTCACPVSGNELYGRRQEESHAHAAAPPVHQYFLPADFQTISRIADLIIPRTDTPGAIDAAVPEYIDMVISRNSEHQALMNDGLRWLDAQAQGKFIDLSEAQQLAILQPLCQNVDSGRIVGRLTQFFYVLKSLTADGYYTSQAGLVQELGYVGNTVRSGYPECVHEH